jgi:hypothetical protein
VIPFELLSASEDYFAGVAIAARETLKTPATLKYRLVQKKRSHASANFASSLSSWGHLLDRLTDGFREFLFSFSGFSEYPRG